MHWNCTGRDKLLKQAVFIVLLCRQGTYPCTDSVKRANRSAECGCCSRSLGKTGLSRVSIMLRFVSFGVIMCPVVAQNTLKNVQWIAVR